MSDTPGVAHKHPCSSCGTGYVNCAEGLALNLKCCGDCDHPGRWTEQPYTVDELEDMWAKAGRPMPEYTRRQLDDMRRAERAR